MAKKKGKAKEGELIKKGPGRKSLYKPKYAKDLVEYMKEGRSVTQIAALWGISRDTFYSWLKTNEELQEAYNVARTASEAWWEDLGNAAMLGQIKKFNTHMYELQVRNRFGWGVDESKKPNQTININNMNVSNMPTEKLIEQFEKKMVELEELKKGSGDE